MRGRIDRLETGPHGEALVIDYKYSAPNRIRDQVKNQDKGEVVQAGLYLLAAVKEFGLTPAGMLYCGLKKEVEWGGWHVPLAGLEKIGESCTRDRLAELTNAAAATAVAVFESIVSRRNRRAAGWMNAKCKRGATTAISAASTRSNDTH